MDDPALGDIGPIRTMREPLHAGCLQLQVAGDAVLGAEERVASAALAKALAYLEETFLPFCAAEEFTLFPTVDGVIGAPRATAVMTAQHRALRAMGNDLRKVADAAESAGGLEAYRRPLLMLLFGLYAAVRTHLESEDDVLIAALEGNLSESQVDSLVKNLERVTSGAAAPGQ